jgi:diguanylate cyclase (GGDEF)-like protein
LGNLSLNKKNSFRFILVVLVCLSTIALAWLAYKTTLRNDLTKASQTLNSRVNIYSQFLEHEIDQINLLTEVLSDNALIKDALNNSDQSDVRLTANELLKKSKEKLGTLAIYVLDDKGLTILDSNFEKPLNFIGKNYAFRPYFQDAITKGHGHFLAIGVTSNQLGYYLSHAIHDNGKVIGAIVTKIDISLFHSFTRDMPDEFLLADERGIIFHSTNSNYLLKSLKTITAKDRLFISRTRQFPVSQITNLPYRELHDVDKNMKSYQIYDREFFISAAQLNDLGWTLWVFAPTKNIVEGAVSFGIAIGFVGLLSILSLFLLYQHRTNTQRYQTIFDNLPSGVTFFDNKLQMVLCNKKLKTILDFPAEMFRHKLPHLKDLFKYNAQRGEYGDVNHESIVHDLMEKALKRQNHVFERIRPDGTVIEVRGIWVKEGLITTYTDITDRKKAETEAVRNATYMRSLLNNLDQGITVTDENLNIIFWNDAFFNLLDFPNSLKKPVMKYEDLIRYNAMRGEYGPGDPEQHVHVRFEASKKFEAHKFERTRPNGRTLQVSGKPLEYEGQSFGFISTYLDITEHKDMASRLRKLANTDVLTDLYNRKHFSHLLEREFKRSQRNGSSLTLLLIDIDRFKDINDEFGHSAGDMALKEFAKTCRSILRDIDIMGRMSGQEFGIFLPDTNRDGAMILAERLRKQTLDIDISVRPDEHVHFTVSIGVAIYDSEIDKSLQDIFNKAAKALARAKHQGRNKISI